MMDNTSNEERDRLEARLAICIRSRDRAEARAIEWKEKCFEVQRLNEKLVEQNRYLQEDLDLARLPWWKRLFGKGAKHG